MNIIISADQLLCWEPAIHISVCCTEHLQAWMYSLLTPPDSGKGIYVFCQTICITIHYSYSTIRTNRDDYTTHDTASGSYTQRAFRMFVILTSASKIDRNVLSDWRSVTLVKIEPTGRAALHVWDYHCFGHQSMYRHAMQPGQNNMNKT